MNAFSFSLRDGLSVFRRGWDDVVVVDDNDDDVVVDDDNDDDDDDDSDEVVLRDVLKPIRRVRNPTTAIFLVSI